MESLADGFFGANVLNSAQREHIDNLRRKLEHLNCKDPNDQDITLLKDEQNKLATICIKSGAKNALSGKMISKLTEILDQLYAWPEARALLIQGHGGTFCSGSDLVCVRETANQESGLALAQIMQYNLMRIQCLPVLSVAWIEGYALGGGAELALGADLRLMSHSAKMGFVHVKVGVCCGWGGASRLVSLVGPAKATELLFSGRTVGADEALKVGLANGLADDIGQATRFLLEHSTGAKSTMSSLKLVINSARILPPLEALRVEGQLFAASWGKEAHLRALDSNIKHNGQQRK